MKVAVAGVNLLDNYMSVQADVDILGMEGVGNTVDAPESSRWKSGDRVGWVTQPGAFAEFAAVPIDRLVSIPNTWSDEDSAACLLQGLTSHSRTHDSYALASGDRAPVYAAAGELAASSRKCLRRRVTCDE